MSPAVYDTLLFVAMFMVGVGVTVLLKGQRGMASQFAVAAILTIGVAIIVVRFLAADRESCVIEGSWVRFYGTPEMCSAEVIDRLSATAPVNVNTNETTEDGFQ